MSREELGDAVAERAAPPGSDAARRTRPTPRLPDSDRAPRTDVPRIPSIRGLLPVVVVALIFGLGGWFAERVWGETQEDTAAADAAAWAVVVDTRPVTASGERVIVDLVVRVANLGRTPLTLSGAEPSFDAGAIESVRPESLPIAGGAAGDAVVRAVVDCRSPQPLRLYPLQVRRIDQSVRTVEVDGAAAVLARFCERQGSRTAVLELVTVVEDDGRLTLTVRSPTGRTTTVSALRAGGIPLSARPLDGMIDARPRVIWIDPPKTCPEEWRYGGLPRTITASVDPGGPATIDLDTGYALPRWARAGPCAEDRP